MKKQGLWLGLGIIAIWGCTNSKAGKDKTKEKNTPPAIVTADLDSSFKAADHFFEFVNEKWIKTNPIPGTESSWGSFNILRENSKKVLREILEKAANDKKREKGSNTQLLGDFYGTGMDSVAIDKAGVTPLKPFIDEINALNSEESIAKFYATQMKMGTAIPFAFYVDQDFKNTTRYILYVYQSGLGLPEKEYYFKKEAEFVKIRDAYKTHIQQTLELSGITKEEAAKQAQQIYAIEEKLAAVSMGNVESRDPYKTYNLFTYADFKTKFKGFDWDSFMKAAGIKAPEELVVSMPGFMEGWSKLLKQFKPEEWKAYYTFHLINSHAEYLGSALEKQHFEFYNKTLEGKKEQEPRWKKITTMADYLLRDALGQEYVKVAFDEKAKARADELIKNLRVSLGERINLLSWMGAETKKKAIEKLNKMMVKIGYPDQWRSYKGLEIKNQPFVLNVMAASAFEYSRILDKLGKSIDRAEWQMGPQTVNAYYNPLLNEIVFPAAILQPPFFYADADDAVNYGGIGMVIGHELTHGFDDQGRQFDADGNLKDWWTEEDGTNFKKLADKFVVQYNAYYPLDSLHVNGELTLGENIADLGGIIIAFSAFKNTKQGKSGEKINGLTPDQRFFISFAQIWRGHSTKEALRNQILTDPHSPRKYRIIGPLSNFQPFYDAFGVQEGNQLFTPTDNRSLMW